jgi:hypothetical protein
MRHAVIPVLATALVPLVALPAPAQQPDVRKAW